MNLEKLKEGLADSVGELFCVGIMVVAIIIHKICTSWMWM